MIPKLVFGTLLLVAVTIACRHIILDVARFFSYRRHSYRIPAYIAVGVLYTICIVSVTCMWIRFAV